MNSQPKSDAVRQVGPRRPPSDAEAFSDVASTVHRAETSRNRCVRVSAISSFSAGMVRLLVDGRYTVEFSDQVAWWTSSARCVMPPGRVRCPP